MNYFLSICLIFAIGEVFSVLIFFLFNKSFQKDMSGKAALRGVLERGFLLTALLQGVPQALILFGALKIGTRFKEGEDQLSNDYFLVGNLISAFLVFNISNHIQIHYCLTDGRGASRRTRITR